MSISDSALDFISKAEIREFFENNKFNKFKFSKEIDGKTYDFVNNNSMFYICRIDEGYSHVKLKVVLNCSKETRTCEVVETMSTDGAKLFDVFKDKLKELNLNFKSSKYDYEAVGEDDFLFADKYIINEAAGQIRRLEEIVASGFIRNLTSQSTLTLFLNRVLGIITSFSLPCGITDKEQEAFNESERNNSIIVKYDINEKKIIIEKNEKVSEEKFFKIECIFKKVLEILTKEPCK